MKSLFLSLFIFSAHAYDVDLVSEKINLGKIETGQTKVVTVRRSSLTPEEVSLNILFDLEYKRCTEERTRRVYVPGGSWPDCHDDGMGRPTCRGGSQGGHWETETYCVRYENASKLTATQLILDFDSALNLRPDEEEIFKLGLTQKSRNSSGFYFTGEAMKTTFPYQVKEKKNKLKFKVQD